ncbi:PREDICTED: uncharacterized protein LOC102827510 [Chrysochloris asiatica]|uniref:BH3-interacting domain death agonist n=1 Tax=Chrysochloris asiatica TaxID=185453 RepID=A0A9B0WQ42_CHRAS|nr:PREDICTED: uncharacterized protein LOC102827510 [Chrysochloris asiatica]
MCFSFEARGGRPARGGAGGRREAGRGIKGSRQSIGWVVCRLLDAAGTLPSSRSPRLKPRVLLPEVRAAASPLAPWGGSRGGETGDAGRQVRTSGQSLPALDAPRRSAQQITSSPGVVRLGSLRGAGKRTESPRPGAPGGTSPPELGKPDTILAYKGEYGKEELLDASPRSKPSATRCQEASRALSSCLVNLKSGRCEPGLCSGGISGAISGQAVSNGSRLPNEHITNLLVFAFLKHSSNCNFHDELKALGRELPVLAFMEDEEHEDLQTDGNRSSHFYVVRSESNSESQEEVIRNIALHLAQIGDEMEKRVQPGLVQNLARHLMNRDLSEDDRRNYLETALGQVMKTCPRDMDLEKTKLMVTMLLAKKVADHMPSLLRDVFRTAVNLINQDLFSCVRSLTRNVRTSNGSS